MRRVIAPLVLDLRGLPPRTTDGAPSDPDPDPDPVPAPDPDPDPGPVEIGNNEELDCPVLWGGKGDRILSRE